MRQGFTSTICATQGTLSRLQLGWITRDLMARMGHDSMNAAIIYQHATREADRVIADALDARMRALRHAADPDEGENRDLAVTG